MATDDDPQDPLVELFERVIEKLAAHPRYAGLVQRAVEQARPLILDYHTHGPEHGYCVSICTRDEKLAVFGLEAPLEELAHIRGIGQDEALCEPLMTVFGELLRRRYSLADPPAIYLDKKPFERRQRENS